MLARFGALARGWRSAAFPTCEPAKSCCTRFTRRFARALQTARTAKNTMLLVTFDEHGGNYDHVPPPDATPPGDVDNTEMGFKFDRLGVRVPAIAISAYTKAGTIISEEMHHAAVIATLCEKFNLEPLTARDKGRARSRMRSTSPNRGRSRIGRRPRRNTCRPIRTRTAPSPTPSRAPRCSQRRRRR